VFVEGASSVAVCIGFGPNRPLLTQDNLRVVADVRTLHVSLDGIEKIRALAKLRPKKRTPKPPPLDDDMEQSSAWSQESIPRVCIVCCLFTYPFRSCFALPNLRLYPWAKCTFLIFFL
jgi:hypothetical protein